MAIMYGMGNNTILKSSCIFSIQSCLKQSPQSRAKHYLLKAGACLLQVNLHCKDNIAIWDFSLLERFLVNRGGLKEV